MKATRALTLLLLLLGLCPLAFSQETAPSEQEIEIGVDVDRPRRPMLALPEPRVHRQDPVLEQAAAELHEVLSNDLRYSGVFDLLDERLYGLVGESTPEKMPYEQWDSVGAEWVLLLDVNSQVRGGTDVLHCPPTGWRPGDLVVQVHRFALSAEAVAGQKLYPEVGVYRRSTGRLPVVLDGADVADRVLLAPVAVQ